MLLHCEVASPPSLWEASREHLSDDWRGYGVLEAARYDHALLRIEELLATYGKSLEQDFGIPLPANFDPAAFANRHVLRELDYDAKKEAALAEEAMVTGMDTTITIISTFTRGVMPKQVFKWRCHLFKRKKHIMTTLLTDTRTCFADLTVGHWGTRDR